MLSRLRLLNIILLLYSIFFNECFFYLDKIVPHVRMIVTGLRTYTNAVIQCLWEVGQLQVIHLELIEKN